MGGRGRQGGEVEDGRKGERRGREGGIIGRNERRGGRQKVEERGTGGGVQKGWTWGERKGTVRWEGEDREERECTCVEVRRAERERERDSFRQTVANPDVA